MKRLKGKFAAIVALLIGLVSWGYLIASEIAGKVTTYDPTDPHSTNFMHGFFMYGLIISIVSVLPFMVEGICSIVRATLGEDIWLNSLSALLTLGLIPMAFMPSTVWFCYYGVAYVAELVFVILHCKKNTTHPG
jgi:hypothetical protein